MQWPSFILRVNGIIRVYEKRGRYTYGFDTADEETGKTTKEGVYAGGDAVTGAATVILAMGAGKAGAKGIDEYLKNK